MSHAHHSEDDVTRRQTLKYVGGTAVAGTGIVAGLSSFGAQRATAQTVSEFEDLDVTLGANERATELTVNGTLTGEYNVPNGNVSHVVWDINIWPGIEDGGEEIDDTIEVNDVDATEGEVTTELSYNMVEETALTSDMITPEPGGSLEIPIPGDMYFTVVSDQGEDLVRGDTYGQCIYTAQREASNGDGDDGIGNGEDALGGVKSGTFSLEVTRETV